MLNYFGRILFSPKVICISWCHYIEKIKILQLKKMNALLNHLYFIMI